MWPGVPKGTGGIVIEILDGAVFYHIPLCQGATILAGFFYTL